MDKAILKAAIKSAFATAMTAAANKDTPQDTIQDTLAGSLSDAMESYVKGIQITIGPSVVNVTGPGGASTNPAPITITNTPPNSIA